MRVQSLGWEDPLEEGMATHSSILAWRIPMDRGAWRATVHGVRKESDTTEQPSTQSKYMMVKIIYTHRYIKRYLTMLIRSASKRVLI